VFLYAFDLLELDGTDMRGEPIVVRKATLASILRKSRHGAGLNEHLEHPEGEVVFRHACKMGLEGIVSKRLGSRYFLTTSGSLAVAVLVGPRTNLRPWSRPLQRFCRLIRLLFRPIVRNAPDCSAGIVRDE
jgi:hypothetical protein